ncbi:MAG TPA: type VII secretion protein EccE [Candidatus Limnocylindrales bacterium]|nr:type VII secretion protein EccE [Candidatus Limnocylindrales bacterium]
MLIRLAGRIAVWQVAVAAFALAALNGTTWAMVAAGILLGITAIRVRGRWIDRWFLIFLRYRGRARMRRSATALGVIAPLLDTNEYRAPGGAVAGVLTDGPDWVVVLRVDGSAASAPLVTALRTSVDPAGPVRASTVQLVRWAVPRPADPDKTARPGTALIPAWTVDWIAVRGERAGLKTTPAAAMRLAAVLDAQGFSVHPLRENELTAELASSLGVAPAGGAAVTAYEGWRSLSLGRLHHATFHLTRPPRDPARLAHALAWLAGPPSLSTCVSVVFTHVPDADAGVEVSVALRVTVPAGRSRREVRGQLRKALGPMAPHTRAMNGRHTEGILATIPLGDSPSR